MANDSGSTGILGVIVGAIIVLVLGYFIFGESLGVRSPTDVNVKVDTPATK